MGLGNPGPPYQATRHNAGFWFLEALLQHYLAAPLKLQSKFKSQIGEITIANERCRLLQPMTYMNHSGEALHAFCQFYQIEPQAILVVHDELDLAPGQIKLKFNGGHGGHNGLKSIFNCLGSPQFLRLRIGIGHPGHRDDVANYVLHKPFSAQANLITQAIDNAVAIAPLLIAGQTEAAMQQLHTN